MKHLEAEDRADADYSSDGEGPKDVSAFITEHLGKGWTIEAGILERGTTRESHFRLLSDKELAETVAAVSVGGPATPCPSPASGEGSKRRKAGRPPLFFEVFYLTHPLPLAGEGSAPGRWGLIFSKERTMDKRIFGIETEFGCLVNDDSVGTAEMIVEQVKDHAFYKDKLG